MSFKGWEAKIKFPVQTYTKERMIDSDGKDATGDGTKTTFYSRSFPITDSAGNPTDDETLVSVYLDDVLQGAATYTLTGAEGKIVFGTAPTSGKKVTMTYLYSKLLGYAQRATIGHAPGLDAVREIGSRLPVEIKEGNITITVTLEGCWLNRDLLGKESFDGTLNEVQIDVMPGGIGAGKPKINVVGKANGHGITIGQDAITMETLEFLGKTISVGTQ